MCRVWGVKCHVRCVECGVSSRKCHIVWSVESKVKCVECRLRSVKCNVWSVQDYIHSKHSPFPRVSHFFVVPFSEIALQLAAPAGNPLICTAVGCGISSCDQPDPAGAMGAMAAPIGAAPSLAVGKIFVGFLGLEGLWNTKRPIIRCENMRNRWTFHENHDVPIY